MWLTYMYPAKSYLVWQNLKEFQALFNWKTLENSLFNLHLLLLSTTYAFLEKFK